MKKRRILGMIISICLLLGGCGTDNENMDTFQPEQQMEEAVTEAPLEDGESGKDVAQTAEDAGSGNETAEDAEKEEASEGETLWIGGYTTAYRRFLEEYVEEENEYAHRARMTLALIDDDNTPELLLIEDNSHASGVKVYTYYQGSVIELGEFGSFGSMQYVERGRMIFGGYSGMGVGSSQFFQIEDGEAKLVCSMMSYQPFDGSPETYEIDGISATEEAFQKKWEELYDADEYTAIGYDEGLDIWESEFTDLLTEAGKPYF